MPADSVAVGVGSTRGASPGAGAAETDVASTGAADTGVGTSPGRTAR